MQSTTASLALIKRGAVDILLLEELTERLKSGRPLRVKLGMDPTSPDLHLGHTVVLTKLRHFQDLGHHIMFLIGDYTGMIGDPSGRNVMRQALTRAQVTQNAATYKQQLFKLLDPHKTEVLFNSEWMDKKSAADLIALASQSTVARMLERDDFKQRYQNNQTIAIHEFLYPLLQGLDSVEMRADVELGGTDQKFNLLMGRELQKAAGQPPQTIITMPLLEGLDGVKKMSKTLHNHIAINALPDDMFGKLMSISDTLMWRYFDLLSLRSSEAIEQFRQALSQGMNPRDIKFNLALEIVARYHSESIALQAKDDFIARFQQHLLPDNLAVLDIKLEDISHTQEFNPMLSKLLKLAGIVPSTSEALRKIKAGAVKVDGHRIGEVEPSHLTLFAQGESHIFQIGRKIIKVRLI